MIKENIKDLIIAIAEGDSLAIEDNFSTVMSSKISDRLDSMRVSVAQGMFGSTSVVEESVELDEDRDAYDSRDAYDLHDPKHPDFVKNHTAWKKKNPEGKLADFVAHMKTKRFNVNEEIEELDEKSQQARQNKTQKNMMDASRGAKWKLQNKMTGDDVRDWDGKHPTSQAQNKAIGRALRNEETEELDEEVESVKVPVGSRPKGSGWELHRSGKQHNEPHDTFKRTTKKVSAPSFNKEEDCKK